MPCIVLDIEVADTFVVNELGIVFDGNVQGYSFRPPERYKLTKQAFSCQKRVRGIVWKKRKIR